MLKGGDRAPAESDIDGRVMALEQTARGLNARLCAIERNYTPEKQPSCPGTFRPGDNSGNSLAIMAEGYDFVPAAVTCPATGQEKGEMLNGQNPEHVPVLPGVDQKPASRRSLSLDIAGLAAGVILIVVSVILYTDNLEILKNPILPFASGLLLIACVCARRHFG